MLRLRKVTVTINHGEGRLETIDGHIKAESTTHLLVTSPENKEQGEWFPKESPKCHCDWMN